MSTLTSSFEFLKAVSFTLLVFPGSKDGKVLQKNCWRKLPFCDFHIRRLPKTVSCADFPSKTRYYIKIFYHILKIMVKNVWAKHRRDAEKCGILPKDILSHGFKASVCLSPLKVGSSPAHVGRKSAIEQRQLEKRKLGANKTLLSPKMIDLTIWNTDLLLGQKDPFVKTQTAIPKP